MKTKKMGWMFALIWASQSMLAQTLTLEVRGIEKVVGHLYVAIYASSETYLKQSLTAFAVEVKEKEVSIPCKGLPAGTYAISLFQDENGNGSLDTGAYGIPMEKFGFSNNAIGVMGPPSFEKTCFTFWEDTILVIDLK